jgi:Terpene synthase family 2, C-terminal metal binding
MLRRAQVKSSDTCRPLRTKTAALTDRLPTPSPLTQDRDDSNPLSGEPINNPATSDDARLSLPEAPLPFPLRFHPQWQQCHELIRHWLNDWGVAADESAQRWLDNAELTTFAAWCYPDTSLENLVLTDKWISLGILFDDQFDSTSLGHRLPDAARVLDHMNSVIEEPLSDPDSQTQPFARAYLDILGDFSELMSPVWMRRHRSHIALWWAGLAQAIACRHQGATVSSQQRLQIRRMTVGMHGLSDLLEVVCGFELPPTLYAMTEIQRMREIITDITIYQNDMCSLEHERADGCDDNVVLAWEAEGHTTDEAIDLACDRIHQLADEFTTLTASLPHLAQRLELTDTQQHGLQAWNDAGELYLAGSGYSQTLVGRYTLAMTNAAHNHRLDRVITPITPPTATDRDTSRRQVREP